MKKNRTLSSEIILSLFELEVESQYKSLRAREPALATNFNHESCPEQC